MTEPKLPLEPSYRSALLAFSQNRKPEQMRLSLTYFHGDEPDAVPEGHCAVVTVEFRPLPIWNEAAALAEVVGEAAG